MVSGCTVATTLLSIGGTMIDLNDLRQRTKAAKDHAQHLLAEAKAREAIDWKALSKEEQHQLLAKQCIDSIQMFCEHAADSGFSTTPVMGLQAERDYVYADNVIEFVEGSPGKIVHDYCVNNGLRPCLKSWNDAWGNRGGYNIMVCW